MSAGKGNGSWANCSRSQEWGFQCRLPPAPCIKPPHTNGSLGKVCCGKPSILVYRSDDMKPYGMWQACGFLSTPQLLPRLWQVCGGPVTSGTTPPAHLHPFPVFPPSLSSDCFPMNYLHKFSAVAGDKTSGTEQQHAPDLSHRRTNGASSTRRAHKGAVPAGALTPLCHSYLLLCHNGPAAPAGLPGR